jgi:hypothetical protein
MTNGYTYALDRSGNLRLFDNGKDFMFVQGDTNVAAIAAHLGAPQEPAESKDLTEWVEKAYAWLGMHEGEVFDAVGDFVAFG